MPNDRNLMIIDMKTSLEYLCRDVRVLPEIILKTDVNTQCALKWIRIGTNSGLALVTVINP
jgi:hypothetical protein